jgi:hypothetical protein
MVVMTHSRALLLQIITALQPHHYQQKMAAAVVEERFFSEVFQKGPP